MGEWDTWILNDWRLHLAKSMKWRLLLLHILYLGDLRTLQHLWEQDWHSFLLQGAGMVLWEEPWPGWN